MAAVVKTAIQFPTEDDADDCPNATSDDVPVGIEEDGTEAIVNGHAEISEIRGQFRLGECGRPPQPLPVVICSSDEDDGSSSDEVDDCEVEQVEELSGVAGSEGGRRVGQVNDKWKIEDGESIFCVCIICDHRTKGYDAADIMKTHVESSHDLSFEKLRTTFKLDYPGFIQFVRWAREMKQNGTVKDNLKSILELSSIPPGDSLPWSSDKYLLPPSSSSVESGESQEDYFLTLDYFALDDKETETESTSGLSFDVLVSEIARLRLDKERMVEVFQRIVSEKVEPEQSQRKTGASPRQGLSALDPTGPCTSKAGRSPGKHSRMITPPPRKTGGSGDLNHDNLYFDSYDDVSIHHDMIFDKSRTDAYRSAIIDRAEDIKGKVVMDLGCGSGILSMFCAQQGAKVVHAVDKSNIIFDAMSNIFENNFDKIIKFHHKDLDNDDTSDLEKEGQVDVLISEFMGYFLFFEGMTESFVRARDKYLKPGGVLMPDRCIVELAPIGPSGLYKSKVACWDDVYDFKMPAMKQRAFQEPLIDIVKPDSIIGNRIQVKDLDLQTCDVTDVYIAEEFTFEFDTDTDFCGIVGFFSVDFTGPSQKIVLATSPWDKPTHWKQAVFFFPKSIKVSKGEKLKGTIKSCPRSDQPRWLLVYFQFGDLKFIYEIK